jgi:hypothetical protein
MIINRVSGANAICSRRQSRSDAWNIYYRAIRVVVGAIIGYVYWSRKVRDEDAPNSI